MATPSIRLVDSPAHPKECLYVLWKSSRTIGGYRYTAAQVAEMAKTDPALAADVNKTFQDIVDSELPIKQNLNFTFVLDDVSISFREQMVRHKIGNKLGDNYGVDTAPDLESSTFWSQSIRYLQPREFATKMNYRLPAKLNDSQRRTFTYAMQYIENVYNTLLNEGVSQEDARELLPVGMTHSISWTLNLATIQHVIGKRGCWLAQADLWEPIIQGMVTELSKLDPYFKTIVAPPCIKGGKFGACKFKIENDARVAGTDPLTPCPLFVSETGVMSRAETEKHVHFPEFEAKYRRLWSQADVFEWVAPR
jgi:thymidylate synthase ThyX